MKKYIAFGMTVVLLLCLCACNSGGETSSTVPGANISTVSNSSESSTTTATVFADVESSTDTTTQTTTINRTTRESQTTGTDSIYTKTTGTAWTTGATRTTTKPTRVVYFDPLKPEIRFFQDSFSVSELGRIVDLVESGSGWFCITEDGSLYELSEGLFSTTKKHYRKIETSCRLKFFLGMVTMSGGMGFVILTQDGNYSIIDMEGDPLSRGPDDTEKFVCKLLREHIVGNKNQLVKVSYTGQPPEFIKTEIVHTFPPDETIKYISCGYIGYIDAYSTNDGKIINARHVCTNKGWYYFYQKETIRESGYVDVPPTRIVSSSHAETVQLEPTVLFYSGYTSACTRGFFLVTEDGTLYYNPRSYIKENC
ncbi:MAG: hypothetical protein IJ518_00610 [Clostridia bacterium]|nr:hypothetical protein [Clostridia bacterium]